jgi:transketolase
VILLASGSEVQLIVEAAEQLNEQNDLSVRVVSFPSWELFASQPESYRDMVLPPNIKARVSIEAGVSQGWERWVGNKGITLGLERYGASAPFEKLYQNLGLTVDRIVTAALELVQTSS